MSIGKQRKMAQNISIHAKLEQPDRSELIQGQSLSELAAQREILLVEAEAKTEAGRRWYSIESLIDAGLVTLSLSMVSFTLDVFVYHQYAQEIEWAGILWRPISLFPILMIIVCSVQAHTSKVKDAIFFSFGLIAGCWLIKTTNTAPYLAVMRTVPRLATLLLWSFTGMRKELGLLSLICFAVYIHFSGFSVI